MGRPLAISANSKERWQEGIRSSFDHPVDSFTAEAELFMIERQGCAYCVQWKKDIGAEEYGNTREGAHAPLSIIDLSDAPPDEVQFARPVVFTPTFILVEDGRELARIEGYPGEDFFWGLLGMMLKAQTGFDVAG